jgi:hypothetical protein
MLLSRCSGQLKKAREKMARFERNIISFLFEKRISLLQCHSEVVGLDPGVDFKNQFRPSFRINRLLTRNTLFLSSDQMGDKKIWPDATNFVQNRVS